MASYRLVRNFFDIVIMGTLRGVAVARKGQMVDRPGISDKPDT